MEILFEVVCCGNIALAVGRADDVAARFSTLKIIEQRADITDVVNRIGDFMWGSIQSFTLVRR